MPRYTYVHFFKLKHWVVSIFSSNQPNCHINVQNLFHAIHHDLMFLIFTIYFQEMRRCLKTGYVENLGKGYDASWSILIGCQYHVT